MIYFHDNNEFPVTMMQSHFTENGECFRRVLCSVAGLKLIACFRKSGASGAGPKNTTLCNHRFILVILVLSRSSCVV